MKNDEELKILVRDDLCEKVVLGTLLSEQGVFNQVSEILDIDCFTDGMHREVWDAIYNLANAGQRVDIVSVLAYMASKGSTVRNVDVVSLMEKGVYYDIHNHAMRLKELSLRRRLWYLGQKLVGAGIGETDEIERVQQMATDVLNNLFDRAEGAFTLTDALLKLSDIISTNLSKGTNLTGTPSGFRRIDAKGGLHGSDLIIIAGESSQGKALRMDELILTPSGWVKNKDLKIGDEIASVDGSPSYVKGIYPQGIKDMYKITFFDGRTAVCSGDHLWEVYGNPSFHGKSRIMTALEIKDMLNRKYARKPTLNVPMFCGKFGEHKDFIIHPYILGVLIGDGCLTRGVVVSNEDEYVYNKVKALCTIPVVKRKKKKGTVFCISYGSRWLKNPYREELNRLGLLNKLSSDKFIPKEYLEADYEQRIELLNGLMDTDGDVDKNHTIHYSTMSEQLANDVVYLCRSLGFRCSVYSHNSAIGDKKYKDHYRITIAGEFEDRAITLPRRKERIGKRKRIGNTIQSVEYIGRDECQCIRVTHPRGLFIMHDFVVTHNSSLMLSIIKNAAEKGAKAAIYSMEMTKEQLAARMIAMKTGLPASDIMYSGELSPYQLGMIDDARAQLPGENIFFDERSTSNIDTILLSIRNMKLRYNIDGAAVDYLQILNVNQRNNSYTREQAMGDAARRLKNLAKELNIWVIALSQLSRNQNDPVPSLSRLRDSGQIAEAADVVMLIYRPEYYHRTFPQPFENLSEDEVRGKAMIDVAKGRNIGVFQFLVNFNHSTTSFFDLEEDITPIGPVEEDAPF